MALVKPTRYFITMLVPAVTVLFAELINLFGFRRVADVALASIGSVWTLRPDAVLAL